MGLVRNLKKTLTNLAEKILLELSSHYIKQRAKQTLKRQDDSSTTTSSRKALTQENLPSTIATSSTGTSEKIIMETQIEPVVQIRDWVSERIDQLSQHGNTVDQLNALALIDEYHEWLNIPEGTHELDYLCLEEEGWGDQEIDIR
jgi:gamma-glutamyl:cysteine ligase YbdK (ATP-grasp superfamily)